MFVIVGHGKNEAGHYLELNLHVPKPMGLNFTFEGFTVPNSVIVSELNYRMTAAALDNIKTKRDAQKREDLSREFGDEERTIWKMSRTDWLKGSPEPKEDLLGKDVQTLAELIYDLGCLKMSCHACSNLPHHLDGFQEPYLPEAKNEMRQSYRECLASLPYQETKEDRWQLLQAHTLRCRWIVESYRKRRKEEVCAIRANPNCPEWYKEMLADPERRSAEKAAKRLATRSWDIDLLPV